MKASDYSFKIILVGPPGVGKTSLVNKYVERKFQGDYLPTTGANVMATQVPVNVASEEHIVTVMVWDIAAQDAFKPMRPSFYNGAKGVFLVGDLTRKESLEDLVNWNQELIKYLPPIPKILLANKCDLKYTITMQYLKNLGKKLSTSEVFMTSALDGQNVKPAFQHLASKILEQQLEKRETSRSKKEARLKIAVQHLYVLSHAGLVIFEQDFYRTEDTGTPTDGDLLGGALVAISELLKDIAKNKSALKVVRQEGFSILVEEGQEILVALIALEESKPLRERVLTFLKALETSLGPRLHVYIEKGQVFPPQQVRALVEKYFG